MTKIVINTGAGFDLTHKAVMRYAELKGIKLTAYRYKFKSKIYKKCEHPKSEFALYYYIDTDLDVIPKYDNQAPFFSILDIDRTDPSLIQVVEELKESEHLDLKIVEVPDDVIWKIEEDEMGPECVREVSRCWS